jgi:hypothetical protein
VDALLITVRFTAGVYRGSDLARPEPLPSPARRAQKSGMQPAGPPSPENPSVPAGRVRVAAGTAGDRGDPG